MLVTVVLALQTGKAVVQIFAVEVPVNDLQRPERWADGIVLGV
jgi:hypothetical protein